MKRLHVLILLLLLFGGLFAGAEPSGTEILSSSTETPTPQTAGSLTTAGGSFTTMLLNATTQTLKWKAYVGNITGELVLQDGDNQSIYDWDLTSISGEVYASRNSTVDWDNIDCVDDSILSAEEAQLNIGTTTIDSINQTFNDTTHAAFYTGTTLITNSNCRAIATYINGTQQTVSESADFQEILLDDNSVMVYATILEEDAEGYNAGSYDFQMIVAEDPTTPSPSTYYFWAELS